MILSTLALSLLMIRLLLLSAYAGFSYAGALCDAEATNFGRRGHHTITDCFAPGQQDQGKQ